MTLSPLRLKLLRDLRRLWAQALAIALVMAAGVATLVLGVGAHASLDRTRAAYYAENRFADLFADVTRAPCSLSVRIAAIDGVLAVQTRIARLALTRIDGMAEPGNAMLISSPGDDPAALNRLHLRLGRMPDPRASAEAVISEGFATAHALGPGDRFTVIMNGRARDILISGVALSPEYIYALGPGDMMPDERRFGIVWMSDKALAAAYDLEGAFSNVALKLAPGASEAAVIARLDDLLAPYGGTGAYGRKDQLSHAFLDAELQQLRGMSRVLPPIFLLVAAFLVNMTLARLVALEREQIGLLKAIGYGPLAIAGHYVEFVLAIAAFGIAIGFVAGAWLGAGLATLYARFFHFPFLIFSRDPSVYGIAALITLGAAVAGAANAVRSVAWLPPAVAMQPPAPVRYRRLFGDLFEAARFLRQSGVMVARHLLRWPLRTGASILGVALAGSVLVGSQWSSGSIDRMIDIAFFRSDRQDAMITFGEERPMAALHAAARLPGVMAAEPFRAVAARIGNGHVSRRVALMGKPEGDAELSRILGTDERPMSMPEDGVILSEALARILGVGIGDQVEVALLGGDRRHFTTPVSGISLGYLGLGAATSLEALGRMTGERGRVSGVHLALDPVRQADFFVTARKTPMTGFLSLLKVSLAKFRETLAENILIMVTVYTILGAIIAVGVVYNFARIALSEQGRELASLRVLGFTRAEVARILYAELAVVVLIAQPLGWLIGYGFAHAVVAAFSSELYRIPLVITRDVYATASLIVITSAIGSALLIRRRINRLDMIEVLKTRE
ncbi:FtsX-like permease family protein [Frigidibacter sp. RF13]|uniref:ABC transporter permease n=1 Tax=Frigidibacter sp. RF13 TaxID=2997340 RepID=UPI002271DCAB|nr:FtsX-like permease family protein [Frigidibacter sp. RF13]MCY1127132.1 FtsX-like permease family protein [Frigidibacter sp. RF13]